MVYLLFFYSQPFINETKRIEFLFELYDKYTSGLFVKEKGKKKKEISEKVRKNMPNKMSYARSGHGISIEDYEKKKGEK